jgi:small subunit ribosomal protein S9
MEVVNTIGRRKEAVARVYVKETKNAEATITVNGRDYKQYFPIAILHTVVEQPLRTLDVMGKYDIKANLDGGGFKGQAEALRMAISRAMLEINPECRPALKKLSLLTRDSREVERKKPGQKKARKRFQFSKR